MTPKHTSFSEVSIRRHYMWTQRRIQQDSSEVYSSARPTYSLLIERDCLNDGSEAFKATPRHDELCELALDDTSSTASTHQNSHQIPSAALAPVVGPRYPQSATSSRLAQDDAHTRSASGAVSAPVTALAWAGPSAFIVAPVPVTALAPVAVDVAVVEHAPVAVPMQNAAAAAATQTRNGRPRRSGRIREKTKRQKELDDQVAAEKWSREKRRWSTAINHGKRGFHRFCRYNWV